MISRRKVNSDVGCFVVKPDKLLIVGVSMKNQVIAEGIRQFAEKAGAKLSSDNDEMFQVEFPNEENPTLIGIENFGFTISYNSYCRISPDSSAAPTLLMENWGGVDGTCFYLSVQFEDNQAYLLLETRQLLDSNVTAESSAKLLAFCRLQWRQANEAIERAFKIEQETVIQPATCRLCNQEVQMNNAPLDIKARVHGGLAPLICRTCVIGNGINIERMRATQQEKILFRDELYLGYGDNFVLYLAV